ncbi:unnamed protein product [Paramecium primaurelia]|uniref:Uncharacterized protein n=1 Tax=Paramecium primaurelia TaxID=5886 RepID=A0A8S1NBK9_PARPR|nr:unnamed protein product [Paramecium primaurelia]
MASIYEICKQALDQQKKQQNGELLEFNLEDVEIVRLDELTSELLESQYQLETLIFTNCSLKTLEGFPRLRNLKYLFLETNQLDKEAIKFVASTYPKLFLLSFHENQIKTFDELEPIKKMRVLKQLDFSQNPIEKEEGYFQRVFDLLPKLIVLDNKDKNGNDMVYSDNEDGDS